MAVNVQMLPQNWSVINATRNTSSDGPALAAAPTGGKRIRLKELTYWLVDPATENTVVLKLGSITLPAVKLNAGRGSFSITTLMGETLDLAAETAIYLNLSGTAAVGAFGRYLVE